MRQRYRTAAVVLSFEMPAGERQLRQRLALVVANDQRVMLERPFAAGEEIAGTAALGRDGALAGARRVAERHEAGAARGRGEPPPPGEIDRRRCRRGRRRRRWRSCNRRRFGLWRAGAGGERRKREQGGGGFGAVSIPRPHQIAHRHRIVGMTNSAPSLVPEGQRAVTVLVLV